VAQFPSLKARELFRVLERSPLHYRTTRQKGSHRRMESDQGKPDLVLAFHDNQTLPPGLVRKILVKDVGLSESEALGLL
jgi:predicted RNA binding protein YcfA (HicA-like mRNA interferase family)